MMKIKDIRKKTEQDLKKDSISLRHEIAKLEIDKFSTDDKDTKKRRNMKRELARILTVLNENTSKDETKKEEKK